MVFLLIGLAIFVFVGIYQHNVVSLEQDFQTNKEFFIESFRIYSLGTIPALDNLLNAKVQPEYGANMFRSLFALLNRLGLDVNVVPLVREYTYVPYPINVYTVYQPYYLDFGYPGIILFMTLIGFIYGIVYRKAVVGRSFYIILYGLLLFPLFMQFFQDQYVSLLTTWVLIAAVLKISYFGRKT